MIEVRILIPVASNEGETFTPRHHEQFEAFVVQRFGGLTREPLTAQGLWIDNDVLHKDASFVYVIALSSITEGALLADVVEFAKTHYDQKAIYVRYLGLSEVL